MTLEKVTKTQLIDSVSCFNLEGFGALFGGTEPPQAPHGVGTDLGSLGESNKCAGSGELRACNFGPGPENYKLKQKYLFLKFPTTEQYGQHYVFFPVCTPNQCDSTNNCFNANVTLVCNCSEDFDGNQLRCDDVNTCITLPDFCNNSDSELSCGNVDGKYVCICNTTNREFWSECPIADECALGLDNCHSQANCINTPGSVYCSCREGYTGNGTHCKDINECRQNTDNCHTNATCINLPGNFTCICKSGFTGNVTTCTDVDECFGEDCSGRGDCTNFPGGFNCTCDKGYSGTRCTIYACDSNNCSKNATCHLTDDGYHCICKNGFDGDGFFCRPNYCSLGLHNCSSNSTCVPTADSFTCNCSDDNRSVAEICKNNNLTALCSPSTVCEVENGEFRLAMHEIIFIFPKSVPAILFFKVH